MQSSKKEKRQNVGEELQSIQLKASTISRLRRLGRMGDTFDSLISEMINHVTVCSIWWEDRYD